MINLLKIMVYIYITNRAPTQTHRSTLAIIIHRLPFSIFLSSTQPTQNPSKPFSSPNHPILFRTLPFASCLQPFPILFSISPFPSPSSR